LVSMKIPMVMISLSIFNVFALFDSIVKKD
jgi:hypothetical protein